MTVDDIRDSGSDIIARTYDAAIAILYSLNVTDLYMDHDLGLRSGNKTGYDVLKYMLSCPSIKPPRRIILTTMNPVGRKNMGNLLKDNGYHSKDGITFYK